MSTVRRCRAFSGLSLLARAAVRLAVGAAGGAAAVCTAGCFVADAPAQTNVACRSVDACPPTHRCELSLGRCLPADETVPQAEAITTTTSEDGPLDVVLQGRDADGDDLVFRVTPPDPAEGTVGDVDGATVTFTPARDFSGTATFAYVVVDDAGLVSLPATVTVDVRPVDDAPYFVAPAALVVDEDQQLQVNVDLFDREAAGRDTETLQVIDVDTVDLAISVAGAESDAFVTQQPDGDIVYVPPPDFFGSDDLTVTARCGDKTATWVLEIVVAPVNDPPTIDVADLSTQEDEPVERPLQIVDIDDRDEDLVVDVDALPGEVGTISVVGAGAARLLRFVPAAGWVGDTAVTVRVRDVAGGQAEQKVDLRVFPTIAAPGARSAAVAVAEDDDVVINLAALSIGPAGLAWGIQAAPLHGLLDTSAVDVGRVVYRPTADFSGADRFVYAVNAPGSSTTVSAAIDVVVEPRPDPPTAANTSIVVPEDGSVAGVIAAADVDGDALTATVTSPPLHGDIDIVGLAFVYEPFADFAGRDTVEVVVDDDGDGDGAFARVTIDVAPVPDAPTATGLVATTREDEAATITLRGASVDADTVLAFDVVNQPAHGDVVVLDEAAGRVTYAPARDYAGDDGFDFRVRSAGGVSATAHVDVVVLPEPDAPELTPPADVVVAEDGVARIAVATSDGDGDAVVIEIASEPRRGSIVVAGDGALSYTPRPDENGADVVGLRPRDATGRAGAIVELHINVIAVPDAPRALDRDVPVVEDGSASLALAGASVDGEALVFELVEPPAHGALSAIRADGAVVYRPAADFFGDDAFRYVARDTRGLVSAPAEVRLSVAGVADAPRLTARPISVDEDASVAVPIVVVDVDDDLVDVVATGAQHGVAVVTAAAGAFSLDYAPEHDFNGVDRVTLTASDATGLAASVELAITVGARPDAPVAAAVAASGNEDGVIPLRLSGASIDGDALSYVVVVPPAAGAVVIDAASGAGTYTPPPDFFGTTTFDYVVVNTAGLTSPPARVTLAVSPVNDPPSLQAPTSSTSLEDAPVALAYTVTDIDGDATELVLLTAPAHGTAVIDAARRVVSFTPAADSFGSDVLELAARDVVGATSAPVRVALTILPVPDAPIAVSSALAVVEDAAAPFALSGTTRDALDLDFVVVASPEHGAIEGFDPTTGIGLYRPFADFSGTDVFRFGVRDAAGFTSAVAADVAITVTAVADVPRLLAHAPFVGTEDTSLDLAIPASDADGDLVDVRVARPTHGTITQLDPTTFRFTPDADFNGDDKLDVTAIDATGRTAQQSYSLRIVAVPDTPEALSSDVSGLEDQALAVQLAGRSVDGDALRFVLEAPPDPGTLASFNSSNGAAVYVPPRDFAGVATLAFRVVNSAGLLSPPATMAIEIAPVNDAPTLEAPETIVVLEDNSVSIRATATDPDLGDVVAIAIVSPPQHGTIDAGPFASLARIQYSPTANFNGVDFLSLRAIDAAGATSATVVVRVDVIPVPDPPTAVGQRLAVREDGVASFALTGSTVDGGALRFTINRAPVLGVIEGFDGTTGTGAYRPAPDRNGTDSFSFVAVDERGVSGLEANVVVTVAAENDLPVVAPRSVVTAEDVAVDIPLSVFDADGDPTTLQIVTNGAMGTATITSATALRYVPKPDANGADTLVVAARDASGLGPSTTLAVTILPVPDPPRASAVDAAGLEDAAIVVSLVGSSADGEAVSFTLVTAPTRGTIESFNPTTGVAVYRGAANFNGSDSFVFTARTATQTGTSATATVRVAPVNDAPTLAAPGAVIDVARGASAISAPLEANDIDGDATTLQIVASPADGIAGLNDTTIRYDATLGDPLFVGTVNVAVVAVDPFGATSAPVDVAFRVVVNDDCATLRNSGVTTSGIYALPHAVARCDMSADGGGWTMVAKIVDAWIYDDPLWHGDEPLNPEDIDPLPTIDAKLEAWRVVPPPDAIRVETYDLNLGNRQRIVLELDGLTPLRDLFDGGALATTTPTSAGLTAWRTTFAPRQTVPPSVTCVREGANITKEIVESESCRLCAFGGELSSSGDKCVAPAQAYGLGVAKPLGTNAGAAGTFEERRRAVLWVRSTDFTKNFPEAKSCSEHQARGRVLSGVYDVLGVPTFCTF